MPPVILDITRLAFTDQPLATIDLPRAPMRLVRGFGSGLATRPGDPPGTVWAIGDRGPNVKVKVMVERYGADHFADHAELDGAKVMPMVAAGPALAELRVHEDRVEVARILPVRAGGAPATGLPLPGGKHSRLEPALDLQGQRLPPDPAGSDTEGLIALADGGFWAGDEYGPSLLRLDADANILARWVPAGQEGTLAGAPYLVEPRLPAIAARRRLNRGFEGMALSPDGARLHVAFQSPLSHPEDEAHARASHVRLWTLDAATGTVLAQHLYPLDAPKSFRRDAAEGEVKRSDIKISELLALPDGRLIVLERASATTKLYLVALDGLGLPPEHLDEATRPTVEELSARDGCAGLPVLEKSLLLDTGDWPDVGRDLEGVALLAPDTLLLASDNDFGVEGAETGFWRVRFAGPLSG